MSHYDTFTPIKQNMRQKVGFSLHGRICKTCGDYFKTPSRTGNKCFACQAITREEMFNKRKKKDL